MKYKFVQMIAGVAAILSVIGFSTIAQAGVQAPVDINASLVETISDDGFFLEFAITNEGPIDSGSDFFPDITGFAVEFGLPDVGLEDPSILDFGFSFGIPNGAWSGQILTAGAAEEEFGIDEGFFELDQVLVFLADDDSVAFGETLGGFTLTILFEDVLQDAVLNSNFAAFCDGSTSVCAQGSTTTDVPEPGTLALFGVGMIGLGAMVRRRRRLA